MSQIPFTTAHLSPELLLQIAAQQLADRLQVNSSAAGPPQLQSFLDAIPLVNDGDVIQAEYFNAIRAALARVAAVLDALQAQQPGVEDTLSLFPTQSGGQDHPWNQGSVGIRTPPDAEYTDTDIPILLPDSVEIRSLRAFGEIHTSGDVSKDVDMDVILDREQLRKSVVDLGGEILALHPQEEKDVSGKDVSGAGPFEILTNFKPEPSLPGLNRVDNKHFCYALHVHWTDHGPLPRSASFIGFQITYAYT